MSDTAQALWYSIAIIFFVLQALNVNLRLPIALGWLGLAAATVPVWWPQVQSAT